MKFRVYMLKDNRANNDQILIADNEKESYQIFHSDNLKSGLLSLNWVYN